MSEINITREEHGSKPRYVATVPGVDGEAELTLSRLSDSTVIADHTGVPDTMRGRGVGKALVERLIEDARADGVRIVPLCPFVKSLAQRRPDWADVIEG